MLDQYVTSNFPTLERFALGGEQFPGLRRNCFTKAVHTVCDDERRPPFGIIISLRGALGAVAATHQTNPKTKTPPAGSPAVPLRVPFTGRPRSPT